VIAAGIVVPPTPDHHVVDAAGALSSDTRAALENELTAYETATGHQLVVFIAQTTGSVPLETYTVEAANKWKIGRKGKEDGAILFVFMQDHKLRIEVGYGLEGNLTDADSSRIITDVITPKMKEGDVNAAVSNGVAAMIKTISPSYTPSTGDANASSSSSDGGDLNPVVGIIIFSIVVLCILIVPFIIVVQIVGWMRYGYLVMREGKTQAAKDMSRWWFWSNVGTGIAWTSGWGSSGGGGGFGGGGGGFSAGGGSFGGGGASGGW
jgi:uncharacterized protein